MKNKLLIIQAALMYLMQIPLYVLLAIFKKDNVSFDLVFALLMITLILFVILLPVSIMTTVASLALSSTDKSSPLKTTMIVKIALIPWYALNVVFGFVLIAGFLNPWLFWVAPLILVLQSILTYAYMLATSVPSLVYVLRYKAKNKIPTNAYLIFAVVFHLIFFLDVIGSIMLNVKMKDINYDNSNCQ